MATEPRPTRPDPNRIEGPADLAAALAALKGEASYRDLTTAAEELTPGTARQASAVSDWTPEALSRGTVSDWLSGRSRPTRAKLLTFLVVRAVPAVDIPDWLAALDRARGVGSAVQDEPVRRADGVFRQPWVIPVAAGAAVVTVVVAVLVGRLLPFAGDGAGPAAAGPGAAPSPPGCSERASGVATVQPEVTPDGAQYGMTFCPVLVNGGALPITGPFDLSGQVLGPEAVREQVLLVNQGDPRTCDALGNRPAPGKYLIGGAHVDSPDGRWSYTDRLGYDEAVTIARTYEYVTGPPDSLRKITDDAATWAAANPGKEGDYPGIVIMPAGVTVLATFEVPAGEYPGAQPCA